jgi:hypothetical protein
MLSEGRRFWFFASSDWHSRGVFGPLDFESTNDFRPAQYQENFIWIEGEFSSDPHVMSLTACAVATLLQSRDN